LAENVRTPQRKIRLRLLCSGVHEAFAEFVAEYQQMVFLCCRTLGLDDTEAEDVAGETFLAAYQKLGTYSGKSKLSTWLWKIAYHKGITCLRKKGRSRRLYSALAERPGCSEAAPPKPESCEQAELIWQAVERLPKAWAVAIILFYREEKSILEIAKIMQKCQNTIKTYLFRGRKRLRQLLADNIAGDSNVSR